MRLLFVSAARRWTGGERCVIAVARGLASRGHAVAFAADPRGPVLERLAPPVRALPVRILNDLDPSALFLLHRAARRHRPDAVCVGSFRELKIAGAAARLAGRSGVVHRMGAADPLYPGTRERLLYTALLDVLVRDSAWGCRLVRRENPWLRSPVLLARNGVPAAALGRVPPAEASDLGAERGETTIAFAGRGSIDGLPRIASELAKVESSGSAEAPPIRLVLFGEAARAAGRLRAELAGSRRVRFSVVGERAPEATLRRLAACDLLGRPSTADGTSFTVLEAMTFGLPVVASRAGGLPEVVADGETGILTPPSDPRETALALARLAADPALRRRMGEAGRARVTREFGEDRMIAAYEAAFRLAARRGRAAGSPRTMDQASAAARSQLR